MCNDLSIFQSHLQRIIIFSHNKYNMLDTIAARPLNLTKIRKENSSPPIYTPSDCPRHIINLDLSPGKNYFKPIQDPSFKAFYNNTSRSWRVSHLRGQHHRSGRDSATTDRQSIVGTPFAKADLTERNRDYQDNTIVSLFDGQHYNYLLKAIAGIRKGRLLSEIRYSQTLNPEGHSPVQKQKVVNGLQPTTESLHQQGDPKGQFNSPKIVNISAELRSRKDGRKGQLGNSFQKVFKNKRKLQNKYFYEKQEGDDYQIGILGDEELRIHKVGWAKRNLSHPVRR